MILLENTGFFKNKADALADYMGSLPDYLVLIFVEEEVDKRNRMYKAVQKQGRAVEFARQDEKTLMTWVLGMMKKRKKITRQDMEDFLKRRARIWEISRRSWKNCSAIRWEEM